MLSFVPLGMSLVPVVGHRAVHDQQPRRVCAAVRQGAWVIVDRPHQVEENTEEAHAMVRMAQRGDVVAADAETAKVVGVPFRPVAYVSPTEGWRIQQQISTPRRSAVKES